MSYTMMLKKRRKSPQFSCFNLMFLLEEKNENEYLIYLAVKNQHNSSNGPDHLMEKKRVKNRISKGFNLKIISGHVP